MENGNIENSPDFAQESTDCFESGSKSEENARQQQFKKRMQEEEEKF